MITCFHPVRCGGVFEDVVSHTLREIVLRSSWKAVLGICQSFWMTFVAASTLGAADVQVEKVLGPEVPNRYKHPAAITELDNGDLVIAYHGGSGEYEDDTAVYATRLNTGETRWSPPRVIADTPFHGDGNPVIWQGPEGRVWLFYVVRYGKTWSDSRIHCKVSQDGARSWSDSFVVAFEPGMMVRNRPIVLAGGDYLLPVYHEKGNDPEFVSADSTSLFLRYNPRTRAWSRTPPIRSRIGNIQPAVVELTADRLICYCRRGGGYDGRPDGYLVRSESNDGGKTWAPGRDSSFPNPNAAVDFLKLKSGNLLLVYNDSMKSRTPLTAALSTDGGKTFPYRRNVRAGPGDFGYPYAVQTRDGRIHVVFTSDRRSVINRAVFEERWLLDAPPVKEGPAGQAQPLSAGRPRYKSPLGLVVDQAGKHAYVALPGDSVIAVVDLKRGFVEHEIPVGGQPFHVDYVASEKIRAYCMESLEAVTLDARSNRVLSRSTVSPGEVRDWVDTFGYADLAPPSVHPAYPNPLEYLDRRIRDQLSSGSVWVFQWPKRDVPATQVAQGWVFTNVVRMNGGAAPDLVASLDEPQQGYAKPSHLIVSSKEKRIFVSCAGADVVLALDEARLAKCAQPFTDERGPDTLPPRLDSTASRHYILARLPTQANPRRMALSGDGKTLVVSNYLADSLTVIDAENLHVVKHIPLGHAQPDAVRRGEILFNSGKMTFQGQFTCASCHPNGGADGLTWDLERDGVGNFKKTKSLLGIKDTAPYGWHGSSPTLADRVGGTLRTLHRHEPTESEVNDLVAYLESLPPPKPLPVRAEDRPAVARGKVLFEGKGQCANCHHRGSMLDDSAGHDVGTRGPTDTQDRFDTPALRGVVYNTPYLHDGRAATLAAVFTRHNERKRHGSAHVLSNQELNDLIAYLKSL